MKLVLSYILTPVFHFYFGLMLLLFHPIQVICLHCFGERSRKKSVDILNYLLIKGLCIVGCRIKFNGFGKIPENRPIIIVSNHQSMYDIPAIVHGFRKFSPKFISKIELSKNIPSISYNLKHGKSALINREKGTQAVKEILKLGLLIQQDNSAACIFPEGTRSKTGKLGKFMPAGLNTLLHAAPSSVIVPFVINGHSQLMQKGYYPLKFGQRIAYTVLDPIEPKGKSPDEILVQVHNAIQKELD